MDIIIEKKRGKKKKNIASLRFEIPERSSRVKHLGLHYECEERAVARLHLQTGLARVLSYLVVINSAVGRRRSTQHRENEESVASFYHQSLNKLLSIISQKILFEIERSEMYMRWNKN